MITTKSAVNVLHDLARRSIVLTRVKLVEAREIMASRGEKYQDIASLLSRHIDEYEAEIQDYETSIRVLQIVDDRTEEENGLD